jgi:7,8-dihydro-6-hydroxymethylpterin-pyrophosphokinase
VPVTKSPELILENAPTKQKTNNIYMTGNMTTAQQSNIINICVKVKGKVVPVPFLTEHHAMEAYWETGGIAPRIL